MIKLIINGQGFSGKDTFVNTIAKYLQHCEIPCYNVSSVDEIKQIAMDYFGWEGEKTQDWRKLLSDLKDMQTKSCNGPFEYMKSVLYDISLSEPNESVVVFFHIREPEEIEKVKNEFDCETILIKRFEESKTYGNHADDNVSNYDYDHIIDNSGTLEEFENTAIKFIKGLIKHEL